MAVITPIVKVDSKQVTGVFSTHYTWTMAAGDTAAPLPVDVRTQTVACQLTPVGSGTGTVQGALTQAAPAAGDWVNWTPGSVSAVTLSLFNSLDLVPKFMQPVCTAGNVRIDVWLWGM